ncbi:uncharacterized protein [Henckelia pumila]|uniref:uncharacterized protein isoform X2 n=1 Tax=Henckelia pumila TaxID=405737 RepID=UPI003C6DECA9
MENLGLFLSDSPESSDPDHMDVNELSSFRGMCDFCKDVPTGDPFTLVCGGGVTFVNADKLVDLRYMSELALKSYNDNTLRSFKLLKVCKINNSGSGHFGLTFTAQEDGSEECPTFRGVVRVLGSEKKTLFCQIKDDDEITLLPCDDDYLKSED